MALIRTSDLVRRAVGRVLEPYDITMQQYNVLRILRGAGEQGLPTLEIAERMVEHAPGVTRLLDRLEAKGLVRRQRCPEDRRQVLCWLTAGGTALVERLDEPVDSADA
ncbi:MAG: MarR family transcriptional regulator, partial [Thermoanaerobaculia bacterium]